MTTPGSPEHLADRQEILDLLATYCRGVDRMDLDLVRSVYAEDGVDHHTGFDGSADDFVAWLARGLPLLDGTRHVLGTHWCEIRGDVAAAETYGTATHWGVPVSDPALNFTTGFRYVDHLVRERGSWRIAERWAVREWARSDADSRLPTPTSGPRGARGPGDPMAQLLARLG